MTPRPVRAVAPVELARRVVVGIGLREVRELEQRVARVGECADENAVLARDLALQVTRLETALVPVLEQRAARRRSR